MEKNNFNIRLSDHFKLYVLLKDIHTFEKALTDNSIPFYRNVDEQADTVDGIRYFLLDKDRSIINRILIDAGIVAQTETISSYDYVEGKKFYNVYAITAIVIGLIIIIALSIEFIVNKYST